MIERLLSVSPPEYTRLLPCPSTIFASVDFNELNASKAEQAEYLVGIDGKGVPVMGIITGLREGKWRSPFSAPMAALSWKGSPGLDAIEAFFNLVTKHYAPVRLLIIMPPEFINPNLITKIGGIAINKGSRVTMDFNYHYDLSQFPDFEANMQRNARKNYHRALSEGFDFETCDISRAYNIISANRSSKGYYLAMTLDQLIATSQVVTVDSFILSHGNNDVAAAIVYHIASGIAHVVYWGDTPGYESMRPMNLLPFHIFRYYHDLGYSIVNVGTSSTDGIPNVGLCAFKESLGCHTTLVPTILL